MAKAKAGLVMDTDGDVLVGTEINELPDSLTVIGNLILRNHGIKKLPNKLTVGGDLDLSYAGVTKLPDNLEVGGDLDLFGAGQADLVGFGVPFIANPDERLRNDAPLNKPDPTTFYGIGPKGYTDYPALADLAA
jgi:hypothetical protein